MAQNFPPPNLPIMDASGALNPVWRQFFQTLFVRSGADLGADDPITVALAMAPQHQTDPATQALMTVLFAGLRGEIDTLRRELDQLRAELDMSRRPPVPEPANPYPFMRR